MRRLLANYYRYIIKKTKAIVNKLNTFDFNKLKKDSKVAYNSR